MLGDRTADDLLSGQAEPSTDSLSLLLLLLQLLLHAAAAAGGASCWTSGVQMTCCQARLSPPLICCTRALQAYSGSAMLATARLIFWNLHSQEWRQQQQQASPQV
jgi:hypothetical protein